MPQMSNEQIEHERGVSGYHMRCAGVGNSQADGIIPRGFLYLSQKNMEILTVERNPASAPDWETDICRDLEHEK